MPDDQRILATGQWLGISCLITRMRRYAYGWALWDSTGAKYRQPDYPLGLRTADHPQSCVSAPRASWPKQS